MNKYQQIIICLLGLIFTVSSFANQSPIKISMGTEKSSYGHVYRTVNITSTMDKLNIHDVRDNRKQCVVA